MFSFASREEHLRQRAARGWTEDEDVLVCIVEIDRLRAEARAAPDPAHWDSNSHEAVDAAAWHASVCDSPTGKAAPVDWRGLYEACMSAATPAPLDVERGALIAVGQRLSDAIADYAAVQRSGWSAEAEADPIRLAYMAALRDFRAVLAAERLPEYARRVARAYAKEPQP
jgi:hypothetical protein